MIRGLPGFHSRQVSAATAGRLHVDHAEDCVATTWTANDDLDLDLRLAGEFLVLAFHRQAGLARHGAGPVRLLGQVGVELLGRLTIDNVLLCGNQALNGGAIDITEMRGLPSAV